jgi:WD40 repeat protein
LFFNSNAISRPRDPGTIRLRYPETTWADFTIDAPWRVETVDTGIPIVVCIKDADKIGAAFTLQNIRIYKTGETNPILEYDPEPDEKIDSHNWIRFFDGNDLLTGKHSGQVTAKDFGIPAGNVIDVEVNIAKEFEPDLKQRLQIYVAEQPLPRFVNWYYGDTHYHSEFTQNLKEFGGLLEMTEKCRKAIGLDWVTATDHSPDYGLEDPTGFSNFDRALAGRRWTEADGSFFNYPNIIKAEEITPFTPQSYIGVGLHILYYGDDFLHENDTGKHNISALSILLSQVYDNAFSYAAHPDDPWFYWEDAHYDAALAFDTFKGLEIWNTRATVKTGNDRNPFDSWEIHKNWDENEIIQKDLKSGIKRWDKYLSRYIQEKRIFISGGSDAHGDFNYGRNDLFVTPTEATDNAFGKVRTVVYCPSGLSRNNIFEALKNGHSVVTDGPLVTFGLDRNRDGDITDAGIDVNIGEEVVITREETKNVNLYFQWATTPEFGWGPALYSCKLFRGSLYTGEQPDDIYDVFIDNVALSGTKNIPFDFDLPAQNGWYYYRVEATTGIHIDPKTGYATRYRCYTNPIWIKITEPTPPSIIAYSLKPITANPGSTLTINYTINNPASEVISVGLGCSIQKADTTTWISDPSNDKVVNVSPGSGNYSRVFVLPPNLNPGEYKVAWGLWNSDFTIAYDYKESPDALTVVAKPEDIRLIRRLGIGEVHSVDWSPDGNLIAAGTSSGVYILESQTLEILKLMMEHRSGVESIAFSLDGSLLASGSRDSTIKLWKVPSGECIVTLNHGDCVNSVAFSPDSSLLASGGWDRTIKLWRLSDFECIATLKGHLYSVEAVTFSPDGSLIASGSRDNTIKLWSVSSEKCIATLEGHKDNIHSVAFNPDGSLLASASGDKTIRLWRVSDKKCMATLEGHNDRVYSVAFSPDGLLIASGSRDNTIKLWKVSDGECIATLEEHTGYVTSLAFSKDSSSLVSGSMDNTICLWRIELPKEEGYPPKVCGYAIIVSGKGGWREKWSLDHNANNAYRVLRNLGFDDERIFYLNSEYPQDIDGDRDDEVDAPAILSNFKESINEVKTKIGDKPIPLILYLTGHGQRDPDCFIFDEDDPFEGYLWLDELKKMLNEFSTEPLMLIVIGSCYSGRFITSTQGISAPNRIIITATHNNQKRYSILGLGGWQLSSDRFWGNLNRGLNVKEAFEKNALIGDITHLWLDDNGDKKGHPPYNLEDDGKLAVITKIGIAGTENLKLTPWIYAGISSPGELRVYDSQNRVTGLVKGAVKEEIPMSIYDEESKSIAIFSPSDAYRYEVVGTDAGTYVLEVTSVDAGETTIFTATDIPTSTNTLHQYAVDWEALSKGEKGVTIQLDSDGDGRFEETISAGATFTTEKELPWDINSDGIVDISDLTIVAKHFGEFPPTDSRVDVNKDGKVDISDLLIVGSYFGKKAARLER